MSHLPEPRGAAAIYAFTPQGLLLAQRLCAALDADIHVPKLLATETGAHAFSSLGELLAETFSAYPRHIFISAAGIAVRAVAPHLRDKDRDPAVVVVDQAGQYAVSLLSGHLGGANNLARQVAALLGGQAVISTATDVAGLPALDELAKRLGLRLNDLEPAKHVSAALLRGERPQLFDPKELLADSAAHFDRVRDPATWNPERPGAWVHWTVAPQGALGLHPPCLFAGLGCRKGAPATELLELLHSGLEQAGLARESLAGLASIEAKRDEPGLLRMAAELQLDIIFFAPQELGRVSTPSPSAMVRKHMGVDSVCEAAAILASGNGTLILGKTKSARATLAVAASAWSDSDRADRNI
ncbi:MAG: cobalt-precorrin 5A hydrolase [Desulfovibrionaceae bacterium]